jgi:hypothetical protein
MNADDTEKLGMGMGEPSGLKYRYARSFMFSLSFSRLSTFASHTRYRRLPRLEAPQSEVFMTVNRVL